MADLQGRISSSGDTLRGRLSSGEEALHGSVSSPGSMKGTLNGLEKIQGYSAYQVAVINGFVGSEEEWLASLKGEDGITPEKGVDYWTVEERAEIANATNAANGAARIASDAAGEASEAAEKASKAEAELRAAAESGSLNGKDGKDGYVPVRGKDYWTDADKAEIKSYVDEAILGGAW